MRAVILAGGKGTRLRPYTVAIPKPLVPIGDDKPILGAIMEQLKRSGFSRVTIAVNHLADIIMAYAGDGSRWGLHVDYSRETEPLHTIGPLTLIDDLPDDFLVMNGDVLCDIDYGAFLQEHVARGNEISISVKRRDVKVDFGVVSFDENGMLSGFKEKPTHEAHLSMGINCFHRSVIDALPRQMRYGFDQLMYDSIEKKRKVWVHEHEGFWLDIGRPEDYQYSVEHFDEIKSVL